MAQAAERRGAWEVVVDALKDIENVVTRLDGSPIPMPKVAAETLAQERAAEDALEAAEEAVVEKSRRKRRVREKSRPQPKAPEPPTPPRIDPRGFGQFYGVPRQPTAEEMAQARTDYYRHLEMINTIARERKLSFQKQRIMELLLVPQGAEQDIFFLLSSLFPNLVQLKGPGYLKHEI
jgi:hypothetical protein